MCAAVLGRKLAAGGESSGWRPQGPHGVTQRPGAGMASPATQELEVHAPGGGGGPEAASGWPGGHAVRPQQDPTQQVFQRGCRSSPSPSLHTGPDSGTRSGSGWWAGADQAPQSSCSSGGSCLGLDGTTCPSWSCPGSTGGFRQETRSQKHMSFWRAKPPGPLVLAWTWSLPVG